MMRHYPDLGSASDWLNQISHAARPIRSPTQIRVVTCHHYGISALVSRTSFGGETGGSVAKCRLFSQARSALEAVVLRPRSVECLCHPPIVNIFDYESYGVGIKSRNFDAAVENYVIVSLATVLDFHCVRKMSDWVEIKIFNLILSYALQTTFKCPVLKIFIFHFST